MLASTRSRPRDDGDLASIFLRDRSSYEAARASWEKTARGLQLRSTQLAKWLGKSRSISVPLPDSAVTATAIWRAHPDLSKLYEAIMRELRAERIRQKGAGTRAEQAARKG